MKKTVFISVIASAMLMSLAACGSSDSKGQEGEEAVEETPVQKDLHARVFVEDGIDKSTLRIVMSKTDLTLSVYGKQGGKDVLVARYPICMSRNEGQKERSGDMRTPESEPGEPFTITEIKNASTWVHDFGDGRGSIKAYGDWFMRLSCGNGIGIHGSTNNEWSIPSSNDSVPEGHKRGRDSEGCIRMEDADIVHLKETYATVGMPVIIKQEGQGLLDWEKAVENINDEGRRIR